MKSLLSLKCRFVAWLGVVSLLTIFLVPGWAAANGQAFAPGSPVPQNTMLVSLSADNRTVVPATNTTAHSLVGVVNVANSSLGEQAGQINVETGGVTNALVSTLNGDITAGTPITASALQGVGAKFIGRSGWIVGLAQAGLTAHSAGAVRTTVTGSDGSVRSVYVESIPVAVKVSYYASSQANGAASNTAVPPILQRIADTLAHKHVSATAIYLSFAIFIIGLIATFVITSTTIRNTFTSLARQPLSRASIMRAEFSSFGIAAAVLVFSIITGLLLLRLL